MADRFLVLIVVAVMLATAVIVVRAWHRRRTQQVLDGSGVTTWGNLQAEPDGRRTLVSFSTPSCASCHTAQAPAVKAVEAELGASSVRLIKVDAARQPAVAQAFGVLTVPSTMVLAPNGRVVAVNHGFAPKQRLVEQLQRA